MSLAYIDTMPPSLEYSGGEPERWTSAFTFERLFEEQERNATDVLLSSVSYALIDMVDKESRLQVVAFGVKGEFNIAVQEASEIMRPVVTEVAAKLVRAFFISNIDAEKHMAAGENPKGYDLTQTVLGYLGKTTNE